MSAAFAQQAAKSVSSALASDYGKLPLSFEANQGQTDAQVKFLSRGQGYALFLTNQGAVLSHSKDRLKALKGDGISRRIGAQISEGASAPEGKPVIEADVIQMQLANANPHAEVEGVAQLPGTANYFIGNDRAKWRTNIPTYAKVQYTGVYPGIDLVYYGSQRQLEYDFVVAPGANPKPIRLHFAGASKLRLSSAGDLTVAAKNGQIVFHKPEIYQHLGEQRRTVEGRFNLLTRNSVGFTLGSFDHSIPLVIDPVLVYSTYLGGSGSDSASAIAVDRSGSAYIAGSTYSTNFPATIDAFQKKKPMTLDPYTNAVSSAFVTKLNSSGTALVYSTYLGGSGDAGGGGDFANGIALDGEGNAYVVGSTGSPNFPVTQGAFQTQNRGEASGGENAFVTKLNSTGTGLAYSTYLGGSAVWLYGETSDAAQAVALDNYGNAYITGTAVSADFPVTKGAFQVKNHATGSSYNGFVAKLNPTGTELVYSTYLGGSGRLNDREYRGDTPISIALDGSGDAYVAGFTFSADFPITKKAFQTENKAYGSSSTGFITKLNPSGSALVYSTYLGGYGFNIGYYFLGDWATGLAVGPLGNAYVTGGTYSWNFPVTPGAFQTTNHAADWGGGNAFIAELGVDGSDLVYSTYLGGSANGYYNRDGALSLALDKSGNAYVTGYAASADFPVTAGAFQPTNQGAASHLSNAFVSKFNPTGTELLYSTYLGGSGVVYPYAFGDSPYGLALDGSDNAYVVGYAFSDNFPVTTGAFQTAKPSQGANSSAFVAKLNMNSSTQVGTSTALTASANPAVEGAKVRITAKITDSVGREVTNGSVVFTVDGKLEPAEMLNASGTASTAPSLALGSHTVQASYASTGTYDAPSSASLTEKIELPFAATPVFSPAVGTYDKAQWVILTDATKGAKLYYTTNGDAPALGASLYSTPIKVTKTETIRAAAFASGYTESVVASGAYTITPPAPTPTFRPGAGSFNSTGTVKLADLATAGLVIYYTTNGDTPTTASTRYTPAGIKVSAAETIKAIAVATGYSESAVATAAYTIK